MKFIKNNLFLINVARILLLSSISIKAHANIGEIDCLFKNIVYEAGNESRQGQQGVGIVTINRAKHYGKTICQTVYKKGQFSWTSRTALKNKAVHTSFNNLKDVAIQLYNTYLLNSEIPKDLSVLKNAMYFSRGKTKGKQVITRIGHHWFCSDVNISKNRNHTKLLNKHRYS